MVIYYTNNNGNKEELEVRGKPKEGRTIKKEE